jgi:hypothetical protein
MMKYFITTLTLLLPLGLSAQQDATVESAAALANRGLVEVRTVGESPKSCHLDVDGTNSMPRFVSGLAPCGASGGSGWTEVAGFLGQYYNSTEVQDRNIALSQAHSINHTRYRGMGEVKLNEHNVIKMQEGGGANIFMPIERVECEPIPSGQTANSRLFRHPETGDVTRMENGNIKYYLPGQEEPIVRNWVFSTFNERCTQLLTQQMNGKAGEGYPVGLCMPFHEASPSNFPIEGERPQYYCMVNVYLQGEKECVGLPQDEQGPPETCRERR